MVVLVAVSVGMVADRYGRISWEWWVALGGVCLGVWAICWAWGWDRLAGLILLAAIAATGALWHHLRWNFFNVYEIARYAGPPAPPPRTLSDLLGQDCGFPSSLQGLSASSSLLPRNHPSCWPAPNRPETPSNVHAGREGSPQDNELLDMESGWFFRPHPVILDGVVKSTPYPAPLARLPVWQREKKVRIFRFYVEARSIRTGTQWRPAAGRLLVQVPAPGQEKLTSRFGLGDRVRLTGQLSRIPPPANPGDYDFASAARQNRVLCTLSCVDAECIQLVHPAPWYRPDRLLEAVRHEAARRFLLHMPQPSTFNEPSGAAQLAGTLLLGLREELPVEYTEPFVRSGTVHLLSISGLHVGMIVLVVIGLMRLTGASRQAELLAVALVCLGYMFLSGARPPTVRATVLVELACLAAWIGRRPLGWNTLAAAGLVILTYNPMELFRLGTQLSFLCVATLFALLSNGSFPRQLPKGNPATSRRFPFWREKLKKLFPFPLQQPLPAPDTPHQLLPSRRNPSQDHNSLRQCLRRWKQYVWSWLGPLDRTDPVDRLILQSMSIPERWVRWFLQSMWTLFLSGAAIWTVVLPLVMTKMHLCPWSGLVLNVVAWVPMLAALASGFVFFVIGWIWEPIGRLLAGACYCSLVALERLIRWGANWSWSYSWTPGWPNWWLIGLYGGLAAWQGYFRWRVRLRWAMAAVGGWILLGLVGERCIWWYRPAPPDQWKCTFLSVGNGLAVLIHLPNGQTWLYDAGTMLAPERTAQRIASYLWAQGIRTIDIVWLSHWDQDHYNALPELLDRVSVDRLVISSTMAAELAGLLQRQSRHQKQFSVNSLASSAGPERSSPSAHAESTSFQKEPLEVQLFQKIREKDITIYTLHAPYRWKPAKDIEVLIFHPSAGRAASPNNANSLVLGIQVATRRVLLTGDLEPPGTHQLLRQPPWDCHLLLAPHHGSRKSEPTALAQWCQPEWVVISGSGTFPTQAAESEYRRAGAHLWHTGRHGAVLVQFTANQVRISSQWYPGSR